MKADVPLAGRSAVARDDAHALAYPAVALRHVGPINRFHGSRWRLSLQLAGRELLLAAATRLPRTTERDCLRLSLAIGSEEAELLVPPRLVEAALTSFGPQAVTAKLGPDRTALLIEAVFVDALAQLEAHLGKAAELRAPSSTAGSEGLRLAVSVALADAALEIGAIAGPADLLARLVALLPADGEPPGWIDPIPVPLSLRHAETRIELRDLRRARPGDALLFDRHLPAGQACLLAGGRLIAPVAVESDMAHLRAPLVRARSSQWEWLMDDLQDAAGADEAEVLDDLPMRVVFEFGRSEMSLKELAGLGAGSIVALASPPGEPLSLLVNGRRIGQGEPVRIGDALGVRITRLFDA